MKEARETLTLNTLHDSTHTKTWRGIRGQSDTDWAPPDVRREDHVVWNPNAFNVFFPNPQHSLTKSLWQNQDKINLHLSFCFTPSAAAATHLPPPLLLPPPTPPQLRGVTLLGNWIWRHVRGSSASGVSATSRPASPQRQDYVSCSLCSVWEGSTGSPTPRCLS